MHTLERPAAAALALCLLAGCATAPRSLLTPIGPAELGQSVEVRQQVTASYRGQTRTLQVALKVLPTDLTLIGLSAIGQRLFTLSWNGREAALTSSIDDLDGIEPARILADLELAYWPLSALRGALDASLRLEQQGTARMLWQGDKLLWLASSATRERWASALTIYNAAAGYRLDIRPLDATP